MEKILRAFFLSLSKNNMATQFARKYGMPLGGFRFVGGESFDQLHKVVTHLNNDGLDVTIDCLGEFIKTEEDAKKSTDDAIDVIRTIKEKQLHGQISLKPSSIGLEVSNQSIIYNLQRLLEEAKKHDVFVTLDMEEYETCPRILELFKHYRKQYDNLGITLQANLKRTNQDLEDLQDLTPAIRIVKGAYNEHPDIDIDDKDKVDENYKKLVKTNLLQGSYTAVATHDDEMITYTKKVVNENNISTDQFEFQMLQGMREKLQRQLREEGYKVRIFVPFGKDWFGYFMKRMAERPANVGFAVKTMLER